MVLYSYCQNVGNIPSKGMERASLSIFNKIDAVDELHIPHNPYELPHGSWASSLATLFRFWFSIKLNCSIKNPKKVKEKNYSLSD